MKLKIDGKIAEANGRWITITFNSYQYEFRTMGSKTSI